MVPMTRGPWEGREKPTAQQQQHGHQQGGSNVPAPGACWPLHGPYMAQEAAAVVGSRAVEHQAEVEAGGRQRKVEGSRHGGTARL